MIYFCKLFLFTLLTLNIVPVHAMRRAPVYVVHHPRYQSPSVGDFIIGVGFLAAIGYGIYKLCDWLLYKSEEQILREANIVLLDAQRDYDEIIQIFAVNFNGIPEQAQQKQIISSIQEPFLYPLALQFSRSYGSMQSFLNKVSGTISTIKSQHKAIAARINKLHKYNEKYSLRLQLEQLEQEVIKIENQLSFIEKYLKYHSSYFTLFEKEAAVRVRYEVELVAVEKSGNNHSYVREALRLAVMKNAAQHHHHYPYMYYLEIIGNDKTWLEQAIAHCQAYPYRANAAYALLEKLHSFYAMVLVEEAYRQELRDYEKAQREMQLIHAQQSQAAAAHAHAQAAQAQAHAMQQQAWQLAQQNQLHQQQNEILQMQTILQATNPPAPTYVNVYT